MPPLLVLDDNVDAADSLAMLLRLDGYPVWVAYDGAHAIALAREHHPSVALLDLGLPGDDGYAVARRLREIEGLEGIRLMAVTAYGDQATHDRLFACGFEKHFVKPVRLEHIEDAIANVAVR